VGGRGLESSKWENDDWGCACGMTDLPLLPAPSNPPYKNEEQNEDGGRHAASTTETFFTSRAITMGRGLKRSWSGPDYP
jgi:hypothetical protein